MTARKNRTEKRYAKSRPAFPPDGNNLWYKYGIHRSYQEIYDAIGKTSAWEKESRLVFLRLLCGRRLNIEKTELLKLCEMLVALEPNNQRFKHLKLTIEMN